MKLVIAELILLVLLVLGFWLYHRYRLSVHRRSRGEVHRLRGELQASGLNTALLENENADLRHRLAKYEPAVPPAG